MSALPVCIPLHDYLLVKPVEAPAQVTGAGIALPDQAAPRVARAEVLAVGPELPAQEVNLVGQLVFFPNGIGFDIQEGGVKYILVRWKDCMGWK